MSSYALAPSPSTDHTAPPLPTCILKRSYLHVCRDLRGKTDCPATPDREERLYVRRRHLPSPAVCIRRHQQPCDGFVLFFSLVSKQGFQGKTGPPGPPGVVGPQVSQLTDFCSDQPKAPLVTRMLLSVRPQFFFFIKSLLIVHSRLPSIHPGRVRTKAWLHII